MWTNVFHIQVRNCSGKAPWAVEAQEVLHCLCTAHLPITWKKYILTLYDNVETQYYLLTKLIIFSKSFFIFSCLLAQVLHITVAYAVYHLLQVFGWLFDPDNSALIFCHQADNLCCKVPPANQKKRANITYFSHLEGIDSTTAHQPAAKSS